MYKAGLRLCDQVRFWVMGNFDIKKVYFCWLKYLNISESLKLFGGRIFPLQIKRKKKEQLHYFVLRSPRQNTAIFHFQMCNFQI